MQWTNLEPKLDQFCVEHEDTHYSAVCVIDPVTGYMSLHGRHERPFRTASTNKIAALLEVYKQKDSGAVDLNEQIYVTEEDYPSGGSDLYTNGLLPDTFTLGDLAVRMIRDSDNTATNVVMRRVGRENIRTTLSSLGINPNMVTETSYTGEDEGAIWVTDHWEYTMEAFNLTQKTTISDMGKLLHSIYRNDLLTPQSRNDVLDIMKMTRDTTRLRGGMPRFVPIAHKAGSLTGGNMVVDGVVQWVDQWEGYQEAPGISHDAGIVLIDGSEYIVAVFTEGGTGNGSWMVREVSAMVFDAFLGGRAVRPITAIFGGSDGLYGVGPSVGR